MAKRVGDRREKRGKRVFFLLGDAFSDNFFSFFAGLFGGMEEKPYLCNILTLNTIKRGYMKLTVVVPVYNVEKFLPRCLDSLLRQGMEQGEWEVICVNDGSPDGSAAILADYEQKHPDIFKVITQENQGLGGARNTGTAQAQGEYVTYLDSDDYLVDGAYRYLLDQFCGDKPDVLCYNHRVVRTDGVTPLYAQHKPDGEVLFDGDGAEIYSKEALPFVWSKFYKLSFLMEHDIWSEVVICQDEIFNYDVFRHHPHTRLVSSNICRYEQGNEGSIQQTGDSAKVLAQMSELAYNLNIMRQHQLEGDASMEAATRRAINNFYNIYHKKLLKANLSHLKF